MIFLKNLFALSLTIFSLTFVFAGVNNDGSFSHTIPIKVPAGTAGMTPQVSLSYNSNAGNGIIGYGWNLTGVVAIQRDTSKALNYSGSDKLIGSGGKLISVGADQYHYENENFSLITPVVSNGTCGDSYCTYKEQTRDGKTIYYGLTDNSRIEATGKSGAIFLWSVSKIEDTHGNYIQYEYDDVERENNHYLYLKRIKYTINNNITTYKQITFDYENNYSYENFHRGGFEQKITQRLKNILVESNTSCLLGF